MKTFTATVAVTLLLGSLQAATLEEKVDALIEEVEALKSSSTDATLSSYTGLGDAASRVYTQQEKLSIGGYGHVDYINYDKTSGLKDSSDMYRAILYVGYRFSDSVIYNSEIEFEHGGKEVSVEFSAIDFLVNKYFNIRTGTIIVPVGNINLRHEPTLFNSVTRPATERYIIPATWSENGALLYGSSGNLDYMAGTVASLNAANGTTIRATRSGGKESVSEDLATVARLTYKPIEGLQLVASGFYGEIDQGNSALNGAATLIWETHAIFEMKDWEITAFYAKTATSAADKVAIENNASAASSSSGYYINIAYDIGKWSLFYRNESYNTFENGYDNSGSTQAAARSNKINVAGLNYRPDDQVIVKADYLFEDAQGTQKNRLELGIGYIF